MSGDVKMPRAAPEILRLLEPMQYVQDIGPVTAGLCGFCALFWSDFSTESRAQSAPPTTMDAVPRRDVVRFHPWISSERSDSDPRSPICGPGARADQVERPNHADPEQGSSSTGVLASTRRWRDSAGAPRGVARRVTRIIDERTGKILTMKSPCIVLEGIVCEGAYNVSCPQAIPPYWQEIWLERIEGVTEGTARPPVASPDERSDELSTRSLAQRASKG